jgi:hypothetical protein
MNRLQVNWELTQGSDGRKHLNMDWIRRHKDRLPFSLKANQEKCRNITEDPTIHWRNSCPNNLRSQALHHARTYDWRRVLRILPRDGDSGPASGPQ